VEGDVIDCVTQLVELAVLYETYSIRGIVSHILYERYRVRRIVIVFVLDVLYLKCCIRRSGFGMLYQISYLRGIELDVLATRLGCVSNPRACAPGNITPAV